ncbi:MAG: hypothetical protein WBA13_10285 [Microcoleaceae cyanobacterium]
MKRIRQKRCAFCQEFKSVLYRVQYDPSQQWVFVCQNCWKTINPDNPHYVYGGTWKAQK